MNRIKEFLASPSEYVYHRRHKTVIPPIRKIGNNTAVGLCQACNVGIIYQREDGQIWCDVCDFATLPELTVNKILRNSKESEEK